MKRILNINKGIIPGDEVRDILEVFPHIENKFRQRKSYGEYYYDGTDVELSIDIIDSLNKLGFGVTINWEEIIIN